jgi:hypothetical protein
MTIKMKKVFLAINDGEIKAVFYERDDVEAYIDRMNSKGAQESAAEYGYSEDSLVAHYQNGYDGGLYSWGVVEIPCKPSYDNKFIEEHGEDILVGLNGCGGEEEYTLQEIRDAIAHS